MTLFTSGKLIIKITPKCSIAHPVLLSLSDLLAQFSVLDQLLHSLPSVLMSNHERQQGAELTGEVGGIRKKLEETFAVSEKEKVRT